jgi:ATP-dependent Clp protease protease subunit
MPEDRQPTEAEEDKTRAEAEKARAEAAAAHVKAKADASKALAEARLATAEAEEAELRLGKARNDRDREAEKREEELAGHRYHHVYLFDKEVSEASVKECIKQLTTWERTSKDPITVELVIDSPGGSVFDGFHLIDYINRLHAEGHTVNTTAYGMAASMARVLLQVGKTRAMGANALLLIHEASFGAMGSMGKIEDQVKMVELMHDRILELFASRSKMTKASITRRWRRRDWWISAQDCLKHGFVDAVL